VKRAWIPLSLTALAGVVIAFASWLNQTPSTYSAPPPATEPPATAPLRPVNVAPGTSRAAVERAQPIEQDRASTVTHPELDRLEARRMDVLHRRISLRDLPPDATAEEAEAMLSEQVESLSDEVRSLARSYRQVDGTYEQRTEALHRAAHLYNYLAEQIQEGESPQNLTREQIDEHEQTRQFQAEAARSKAEAVLQEIEAQ